MQGFKVHVIFFGALPKLWEWNFFATLQHRKEQQIPTLGHFPFLFCFKSFWYV